MLVVSVSTISLRTDDKKLNKKGKELRKDNSTKIKPQHVNKGKLHLTRYGSTVLSNNFVTEISKVLH